MPISNKYFIKLLDKNGINFFTGVPDSLLKGFCSCIDENLPSESNIVAANEGNALAIAAGYYLSTGKIPLVYMQNSGFGNAVNPLLSLCDSEVYSIPSILLIGWRGEPGIVDEPQHVKQGMIQLSLLEAMKIPYKIISKNEKELDEKVKWCITNSLKESKPYAILVKKGTFNNYKTNTTLFDKGEQTREESLIIILDSLPKDTIVVSTTGKTSREIFELREQRGEQHSNDFLTVGSMGHCSSIALGVALQKPKMKVVCIDGDGSLLMHLGAISTISRYKPQNFYYLLLNNFVHESVGGQKTAAENLSFPDMLKSMGFLKIYSESEAVKLKLVLKEIFDSKGPNFLEVIIKEGSRKNLGRPDVKPKKSKEAFMEFVLNNN